MSIEEDLYQHLKKDLSIISEIEDRIYQDRLPQNVIFPALSIQLLSEDFDYDTGGETARLPRFSLVCYADTRKQASDISEVLVSVVSGFSGTIENTEVDRIFVYDRGNEFNDTIAKYETEVLIELHYP
jgi:hypothetical protein